MKERWQLNSAEHYFLPQTDNNCELVPSNNVRPKEYIGALGNSKSRYMTHIKPPLELRVERLEAEIKSLRKRTKKVRS